MNDTELIEKAHRYCMQAHHGQTRHDGSPYYRHPEAVADLLRQYGMEDSMTLAAAYLHDVLEDTSITHEQMATEFGEPLTQLVEELTNIGPPGRSFDEKHAALAEEAARMSVRAKWVKLADRLHNLSEMHVWPAHRQHRYAHATVTLLAALRPWPCQELGQAIEKAIKPLL